jgi:hypothetical protein
MIKKIVSIITISFIVFSIFSENTFSNEKQNYFIITAYYSPLPNQSHYIMWTYKKELRMNGKWIRWASGKKVFSWMLAAPSTYSFWTKIKLEWIGIWEVADRWGAIVKAWVRSFKYDRIDIWMWHWEEGLQRAMHWWTRIIKWNIINKYNKVNLNLSKLPAPKWTKYHAIKNPDFVKEWSVQNKVYLNKKENKINSPIIPSQKGDENKLFNWPIKNSTWVKELQKKLQEINLYSWKINWEYSSIRKIILDFQLKNNVISKNTDIWAGNFWPKTRKTLKEKYNLFIKKKEKEKLKKIELEKKEKLAIINATNKINSIWKIKFWDISNDVRMCQKALNEIWYFKYKDTAIFWEKTKQSIINYQLDRKLISSKNIYWAGIFWPKTRKSLIKDLSKIK